MATTSELLISINNSKLAIKDSIENAGVSVGTIQLDQYASKIDEVYQQYTRPSEWLDIAGDIGPTDEKMVGLYMVCNTSAETVSVKATTSSGTFSVDWGDGSSSLANASTSTITHTYSYSDTDLTSTTYGYKVAKVVVTPDSGNILSLKISPVSSSVNTGWLDLDIRLPSLTSLQLYDALITPKNLRSLKQFRLRASSLTSYTNLFSECSGLEYVEEVNSSGSVTTCESMFNNCVNLRWLSPLNLPNCTSTAIMFYNCFRLKKVPELGLTTALTNVSSMYNYCRSLEIVPTINLVNCVTVFSMYSGCFSIKTVPSMNLTNCTNAAGLFSDCYELEYIGAITKPSSSTVATTFTYNYALRSIPSGWHFYRSSGTLSFAGCNQLRSIPSVTWGTLFSIDLTSCYLDATALDEIYTSLPTVTSKTITVTGNPGVAGDTPSIATAKGWTVSG